MEIRTRLKTLRLNAGYTQNDIADYLHIAQKTYSDYELGKSTMSASYLIQLAELYNVNMDYMCCITDIPAPFPGKGDTADKHPSEI